MDKVAEKKTALERIDEKLEQLRKRRLLLANRETKEKRATRTRKAIIVGSWIISNDDAQYQRIINNLTRDQDRAVFGLTPLPPAPAPELATAS